jgi:uncharacterized membrane protein YkoI
MRRSICRLLPGAALILLLAVCGCQQQSQEAATEEAASGSLKLEEIPQVVMDGLMARFPGAEIHKWTREVEDGVAVYDFEFTQEGLKLEADVREDGTIHNWERAIEMAALPDAVAKAVQARYPNSTVKGIMETKAVVDGEDVLEEYELDIETADMKEVEIVVAPDGKVLEDSGQAEAEEATEQK